MLFSNLAHATLARPLSLTQLVTRSDAVVVARVIGKQARYDQEGRIVTDVALEVERTVRGDAGRALTLLCFGGNIGEVGMRIAGEPELDDEGRYLLFLRNFEDRFRPVGMSQGVMRIEDTPSGTRVHPGGQGLSFTQDGQRPSANPMWSPRSLDALIEEIESLR